MQESKVNNIHGTCFLLHPAVTHHVEEGCPEDFNHTEQQRIVIIGAGPTALGAAHRLYKSGVLNSRTQVIILEQQAIPGGLASSHRDGQGFLWDNGGHVVFSHYTYFDHALDEAVPEWNKHIRDSYALMKGSDGVRRFIPYPVQENIHLMDRVDRERSLSGLEKVTPTSKKPASFDQWLLWNFGEGLYDIFMHKYNRKVWTVDPVEMNAVWVGERVAVPNITRIRAKISAMSNGQNLSNDVKWGPNRFFRFPRYSGTGGLWGNITLALPQGWFHFNQKVITVDVAKKRIKVEAKTEKGSRSQYLLDYDYLISTAPLDSLLKMINDTDPTSAKMVQLADELVYSHTHIMGIGLTGQPPHFLTNKSWMYFPDSDSPFYRVTTFSRYSDDHVPMPGSYWSLMCEAAEPKATNSPEYWTGQNLLNLTTQALVKYDFIAMHQVVSQYHRRLDHGYPVPTLTRDSLLATIQPWLQSKGIYSRGRFGGWRYEVGNQDHSFMQGVEVADLIMRGVPEDTYPDPNYVNSRYNINRMLQCSVLPEVDLDYEVVVAHYDENLDWLAPHAHHCHIYHKGNEVKPRFLYQQWEKLPNVGREGHTFLHHIINNYKRLANVTVFVQGCLEDHFKMGDSYGNVTEYMSRALTNDLVYRRGDKYASWGRLQHIGKFLEDLKSGKMRPSEYTFGEFYEKVFLLPHPPVIATSYGACFAVTRERILRRPKELYQRIINYLSDHPNPEEGHYLERLWVHLFSE